MQEHTEQAPKHSQFKNRKLSVKLKSMHNTLLTSDPTPKAMLYSQRGNDEQHRRVLIKTDTPQFNLTKQTPNKGTPMTTSLNSESLHLPNFNEGFTGKASPQRSTFRGTNRTKIGSPNKKSQMFNTTSALNTPKHVPRTYQEWKKVEAEQKREKEILIQPNVNINRERRERLLNVQSKIRSDALSKTFQTEEQLEEGLRQKLSRLKQINVSEEPFTYSLSQVHDRTFIHKILPCIQRQQVKHSPIGCSNSKSPNLLRNTFSVEMYGEFLKHKKKIRNKAGNQTMDEIASGNSILVTDEKIKVQDNEVPESTNQGRWKTKFPKLKQSKDNVRSIQSRSKSTSSSRSRSKRKRNMLSAIGLSFKQKMERMVKTRKDQERKQKLLEQLRKKRAKGGLQFDVDFFSSLEQKDMDARLIEIIIFEINKMFSQEMSKYRGVTSEFNAILKRKNLLEAKLFKKRYEKVQKHLNGIPNLDKTLNPFSKRYQPSIFNESFSDNKMDIPHNRELYENVIKQAFGNGSQDDFEPIEEENLKDMTDEEIINRIKLKFRKRVIEEGPSIEAKSLGEGTRFFERMIDLSNLKKVANRIQGGFSKHQRTLRVKHKSLSVATSPLPEVRYTQDDEQNKSSFFITQGFLQMPSQSQSLTPKSQFHPSRSTSKPKESSSNITNYLNFLTNGNQKPFSKASESIFYQTSQNSTITLSTNNKSRQGVSYQKNPFKSQSRYSVSKETSKISSSLQPILTEIEKEIVIKDQIKERAKSKTLSTEDWDQIGQSKVLQFTILDKIIEDCGSYEQKSLDLEKRKRLGLSSTKLQELYKSQYGSEAASARTSKEQSNLEQKKKNMEDTFTFLDKLKRANKLADFERLQFE